jgi:hypothetical protein
MKQHLKNAKMMLCNNECNVTKMYGTNANAYQHLQNENLKKNIMQQCLSSLAHQA